MDSAQQSARGDRELQVRPVDMNPALFRTGRVPLVIEGVLLIGLGVWGLVANAMYAVGPAGAPVLVFHFTMLHSCVLLVTGLLAVISARRRRGALIFTGGQFLAFMLLFAVGSVAFARAAQTPMGFDSHDSVLHLIVAVVGAALFMWLAGQLMEGRWWVRDRSQRSARDRTRAGRDAELLPRAAGQQAPPMPHQNLEHAGDPERFALGLQDDSGLDRAKLGAGVVSVVGLVAMFITSLFRAPSIASMVVLAVLAVGLSVKISAAVLRKRQART